jgi:hypothetical protein
LLLCMKERDTKAAEAQPFKLMRLAIQVTQAITEDDDDHLANDDEEIRGAAFMCRNRRPLVPAFTTLVSLLHASVLKHTLDSHRWAPGEGLEPLISS